MSISVADLKPGSVMAIVSRAGFSGTSYHEETVERITKTRVITDKSRFVIRTGGAPTIDGHIEGYDHNRSSAYLPGEDEAEAGRRAARLYQAESKALAAADDLRRGQNRADLAKLDELIALLTVYRELLTQSQS